MYQKDTMSLNNTNCNELYHQFSYGKQKNIFMNSDLFLINIDEKYKKMKKKLVKSKEMLSNRERVAHFLLNSNRNETLNRGNEYE
mgnify:FL=1|tara:strand:+ start:955 stop:1209 length:255 start_codon:yes stop_codon:yes gene_type:complete